MERRDKEAAYDGLLLELAALLDGLDDPIAAMASCACALKERLPYASWVGFYRVVAPELLRVGPYQGPHGCLEIPFGKGVCGAAAREGRTQLVPDVHRFPGHIACDPTARSEVVVPLRDPDGELCGVLDLDSRAPAAFDEVDQRSLERLAELLRPALRRWRTGGVEMDAGGHQSAASSRMRGSTHA